MCWDLEFRQNQSTNRMPVVIQTRRRYWNSAPWGLRIQIREHGRRQDVPILQEGFRVLRRIQGAALGGWNRIERAAGSPCLESRSEDKAGILRNHLVCYSLF